MFDEPTQGNAGMYDPRIRTATPPDLSSRSVAAFAEQCKVEAINKNAQCARERNSHELLADIIRELRERADTTEALLMSLPARLSYPAEAALRGLIQGYRRGL